MGLKVEYEECTFCSGTGLCTKCLGDGRILSGEEFVDCTQCYSLVEGGCLYCQAEGKIREVTRTNENDIELDFSGDISF